MIAELAGWANIGAVGLLSVVFLAVMTGWLIPRWTHLERVRDFKETIASQKATIAERDKQIDILLGRVKEPTG